MPPSPTGASIGVEEGQLLLKGSLDNTAGGVIGEDGNVSLETPNTSFTNEGTIYMLFGNGSLSLNACDCSPDHNRFVNTGTIYFGVYSANTSWGGFGLHASIGGTVSETVALGGTIVPVPVGEPPKPPIKPTYHHLRGHRRSSQAPAVDADLWGRYWRRMEPRLQPCGHPRRAQ